MDPSSLRGARVPTGAAREPARVEPATCARAGDKIWGVAAAGHDLSARRMVRQ